MEKKLAFTGERYMPGATRKSIEKDHVERYKFCAPELRQKDVLDIACGVGYGSNYAIEAGAKSYLGVDIDKEAIEYAAHNFCGENVNFIVDNICNFSPDNKLFDIVLCYETIEHVRCYKDALKNIYSIIRPGGGLYISSPNRIVTSPQCKTLDCMPSNIYHTQEFTIEELVNELRKVGFFIREDKIYGQRIRWKVVQYVLLLMGGKDYLASLVSPKVNALNLKLSIPRYFIVLAEKPL